MYDALNKEGALPADKQVTLPKDFSPDAMKGWLDLVPIAIDLGTDCWNFLMEKGFVSSSANLPQAPQLDDAGAKGGLDLIPVALSTGQQILDALTKEAGQLPTMTKGVGGAAPSATKEVVRSFSQQILNQSGGRDSRPARAGSAATILEPRRSLDHDTAAQQVGQPAGRFRPAGGAR